MFGTVARVHVLAENREKLIEVLTNEPEWSDGEDRGPDGNGVEVLGR
jgi:hypothetical protein